MKFKLFYLVIIAFFQEGADPQREGAGGPDDAEQEVLRGDRSRRVRQEQEGVG